MTEKVTLTTTGGAPIADNQNSQTAGPRGPVQRPDVAEPPLKISGDADRYDHREGNDDYSQPRALYKLFDDGQKRRLYSNIAAAMQGVPDHIIDRQMKHFEQIHPDYAAGVRAALEPR